MPRAHPTVLPHLCPPTERARLLSDTVSQGENQSTLKGDEAVFTHTPSMRLHTFSEHLLCAHVVLGTKMTEVPSL